MSLRTTDYNELVTSSRSIERSLRHDSSWLYMEQTVSWAIYTIPHAVQMNWNYWNTNQYLITNTAPPSRCDVSLATGILQGATHWDLCTFNHGPSQDLYLWAGG